MTLRRVGDDSISQIHQQLGGVYVILFLKRKGNVEKKKKKKKRKKKSSKQKQSVYTVELNRYIYIYIYIQYYINIVK